MAKIIKLTDRQLREAEVSDFTYLDTDNDKASYDGKSQISVNGKIDNDTVGDTTTSDKIASVLTPQSYNRFHSYGSLYGRNMREGVDINKDNVDDFYNNDELDTLSNGDINDNLTKIPQGVEYKTDVLIDAIDTLRPKQQAIVLNKILENLDMSSIPYMWKKELIMKLMTNNKNETKQNNMIHLLFEGGNSDLKGRTFPLPDGIRKLLKEILNSYDGDRNVEGYKRLNNILDMKTISYQEMKRLKNYFDNFNGDINSDEYKLNGGDALKTWVNNTLNTATTSIRNFKQAKKDAGISNAFIKSHNKDRQTHNKLKPTQSKFKTNDISNRIKDNTSIKYEGRQRKTIYISEQQYRLIKEAQDATFNVNELSAINSFRGRYNYCLQHLGPTIGKGSSRTIFQLSDERVLKLAINTKGIAQNEQEGQDDYYLEQLDITPQIFEKDEDGKWLISEYVLPAKKQDFQECLGIDEKTFFNFLITSWVNAHGRQKDKYVYGGRLLNDELFYELTEREELMNWYDYISNYDMPLGDIIVRRNYGMTVRNGYPVIVLLDIGLTDEIYNNYYKR